MWRSIGAVVGGVIVGGLVVFVVEVLGQWAYPPPTDLDLSDPQALQAAMMNAPVGALLFVLLAWAVGSLAGGWTAARIARSRPVLHAVIVGGFLLAAGIANLITIPHPPWFTLLSVLVFLPAAYAGSLLARRSTATS